MERHLPREFRDMIYSHLLHELRQGITVVLPEKENEDRHNLSYYEDRGYGETNAEWHKRKERERSNDPFYEQHMFNVKYMGSLVAGELQNTFCKERFFVLRHDYLIAKFINTPLASGTCPRDLIRGLRLFIDVREEKYDFDTEEADDRMEESIKGHEMIDYRKTGLWPEICILHTYENEDIETLRSRASGVVFDMLDRIIGTYAHVKNAGGSMTVRAEKYVAKGPYQEDALDVTWYMDTRLITRLIPPSSGSCTTAASDMKEPGIEEPHTERPDAEETGTDQLEAEDSSASGAHAEDVDAEPENEPEDWEDRVARLRPERQTTDPDLWHEDLYYEPIRQPYEDDDDYDDEVMYGDGWY